MSTQKAPGQALVAELDAALPPGVEWTKVERTTLASVEVMADRLAALRQRADVALADPGTPAAQVAVLANATRQLEVSMHTLIKSLDPDWHGASS